MMNLLAFINNLKAVDIVFFIVCAAMIGIAVGVYFLLPVLNKKQYQEQRDNLRKREEALKADMPNRTQEASDEAAQQAEESAAEQAEETTK